MTTLLGNEPRPRVNGASLSHSSLDRILGRPRRQRLEDHRRCKRFVVGCPTALEWRVGGTAHEAAGVCLDLSEGGARIKASEMVPVNARLHLRFPELRAEADGVVRYARGDSIGVEFEELIYNGQHRDPETAQPVLRNGRLIAALGFLLWLAVSYAVPGLLPAWVPFARRTAPQVLSPPSFFTLGSTRSDVYAVQGPPSLSTESTWHYGPSQVFFRGNYVVGWKTSPNHSLFTGAAKAAIPAARQVDFTVGSTAEAVLAAQGPPEELTDDAWKYGTSEVYFKDGKVVGWKNTAGRPLKAKPSKTGSTAATQALGETPPPQPEI